MKIIAWKGKNRRWRYARDTKFPINRKELMSFNSFSRPTVVQRF